MPALLSEPICGCGKKSVMKTLYVSVVASYLHCISHCWSGETTLVLVSMTLYQFHMIQAL